MAAAIDAIVTHQPGSRAFRVMTAVAYYAGLRPSEVVMLRVGSTVLPAEGWGRLEVSEADISFDEPGEPKTGPRSLPIASTWLRAGMPLAETARRLGHSVEALVSTYVGALDDEETSPTNE